MWQQERKREICLLERIQRYRSYLPSDQITAKLDKFKADLATMEYVHVVQKHVLSGSCYILHEDAHYELKRAIASEFDINPNDVFVVGSAKLGFSIASEKRYRLFGDQSDIDVAIVSNMLFDSEWQKVFEYWDRPGRDVFWNQSKNFMTYLFRGWIRPDMLPPARDFPHRLKWPRYFQSLTASGNFGPYKIAGGLYKSLYFLERYQGICVRQCQEALVIGG